MLGYRTAQGIEVKFRQVRLKPYIVLAFSVGIEQNGPGKGHLIQQTLRFLDVDSNRKRAEIGHLPTGGCINDVGILLKLHNAEPAIVVWRLLSRWNAKPFVIRIERQNTPLASA